MGSDNTTFYVFTQGKDGSFEAVPIKDWYNFTPILTYKTLDAEEAEERFAQRGKVLNKWAVMVHKKLKPEQDDAELDGEEGEKKKGTTGKKDFKISDMDDWEGSDDGLDTEEEKEKKKDDDSDDEGKSKKKGKDTKKKKKNKEEKDEAFDDSEDDDRQDREVDYM